eukprot:scaffold142987_cov51-Attheya_sp.AAC.1
MKGGSHGPTALVVAGVGALCASVIWMEIMRRRSITAYKEERTSTTATAAMDNGTKKVLRVGLVGLGAIGETVAHAICHGTHGLRTDQIVLHAVLVRHVTPERIASLKNRSNNSSDAIILTSNASEFFAADWDLMVEAAGQEAVRLYAAPCLQSGRSVLLTSIGALTDDSLLSHLEELALLSHNSRARLLLASGAMPGLDWMHSSSLSLLGDDSDDASTTITNTVTVTQSKPPSSWKGARVDPENGQPLADMVDLDMLMQTNNSTAVPVVLFEGSAREAARSYPKNANVCAMLALGTGVGLDDTHVQLVADPIHFGTTVTYEGAAGTIQIKVTGKQSATNPRTSAIVPLSVIKALKNLSSHIGIGI